MSLGRLCQILTIGTHRSNLAYYTSIHTRSFKILNNKFPQENEKTNSIIDRFFKVQMPIKEKILSLKDYKKFHIETFEEYKKSMKDAFPNDSEEELKKSYEAHCHSIYKLYKRTQKSDNDPGTIL